MGEFEELAKWAEMVSGADRGLDALIWVHLPAQKDHSWKHDGDKHAHAKQITGCDFIPCYTASLDCALTLLPEGAGWDIEASEPLDPSVTATIWGPDRTRYGAVLHIGKAENPALAFCAAGLRAIATQDQAKD